MRLDKMLAHSGFGSRKEVKAILKRGLVMVDGSVVTRPEYRLDVNSSKVFVNNEEIKYEKYIYLMMNKPVDVISATVDEFETTVIDLLDDEYAWFDLFPVGRLDKDTTGLIILSNDGKFAHSALSPKKHVEKVYHARISQPLEQRHKAAFAAGITLDDGYQTMPAGLTALDNGLVEVTIKEGKFHQIKRMFKAIGLEVQSLHRHSFADIALDYALPPAAYRRLNDDEMAKIANIISKD